MFGRRKHESADEQAQHRADAYQGLRDQVLDLDPATVGIVPDDSGAVTWGCVMDTGHAGGTATLVCLRDGTTSLYTSSGFGIIGGGAHEAVVRANAALLAVLDEHLALLQPSADRSLPATGHTVIRAMTFAGPMAAGAPEDDLGYGRSPLSPVFHAAHGVITELRLLDEQGRRQA